jgi:hypothetical protein
MNRDDILRHAEACGIPEFENNESQADVILHFAALVAAAEREACAKLAFNAKTYIEAAAAIRARGQA